ACESMLDLLRADEMDVRIDPTRGHDTSLGGDYLRRGTECHRVCPSGYGVQEPRSQSVLNSRIAGVPYSHDAAVFHADITLHHAEHGVDDQRVCEHQIQRVGIARKRRLPHTVANNLPAAKLYLIAVTSALGDEIPLDLGEKL